MRIFPRRLGPKLNLSLLVFLLLLGTATATLVLLGFRRTQDNATARSQDALEDQGKLALQAVAGGATEQGGVLFETAAETGRQGARFLAANDGSVSPSRAQSLAVAPSGVRYDSFPNRRSDLVLLNGASPDDTAVQDDIAFSAALDDIAPALLGGVTGAGGDPNFHPIAMMFVSTTGVSRYYPPVGIQDHLPPTLDIAQRMEGLGPVDNPDRHTIWTAPHLDPASQGQVVTARTPVYAGDTFRGSLEVDLSLSKLIDSVNGLQATARGFAFYVDAQGDLLRSSAFELLDREAGRNPGLAAILANMKRPDSSAGVRVEQLPLGDEEYFVAYAALPSIGGALAVAAPVSDVTARSAAITAGIDAEGRRTVVFVLATMLVFFAAALLLAAWLNRRSILRPIEEIVAGTRAIAAGDLTSRIAVRSSDEFGMLADSFNVMTSEVRDARESLERRVEVRTRELTTMLDVARNVGSTLELEPLLHLVLEQVGHVAPHDRAALLIRDGDTLRVAASMASPGQPEAIARIGMAFPLATVPMMWAQLSEGDPVIIDDVRADTPMAAEYRGILGPLANRALSLIRSWMAAPLMFEARVIGIVILSNGEVGFFKQRHAQLTIAIGTQASVAIENARLFQQTEERTRELSTLLDVSNRVASTLHVEPMLNMILEQVQSVAPYDRAAFLLLEDDGGLTVRAVSVVPGLAEGQIRDQIGLRFPTSSSRLWDTMNANQAYIIDDVRGDSPGAHDYRSAMGEYMDTVFARIRGWMGVPVSAGDKVIGVLALSREIPNAYTPRHGELAKAIASQAAVAVEHARLFEETQQQTRELSALLHVSRTVATTLDRDELVSLVLDQLGSVIEYTGAAITVLDGDGLTVLDSRTRDDVVLKGAHFPLAGAEGLSEWLATLEPAIIADIQTDQHPVAIAYRAVIGDLIETPSFRDLHSWMAVPLAPKDNAIGLLTISRTETGYFTTRHASLARAIADQAALAIDNARLFEETQQGAREMGALLSVTQGIASSLDVRTTASLILDYLKPVVDYQNASISLLNKDELGVLEHRGPMERDWLDKMRTAVLRRDLRPQGVASQDDPRHAVDMFGSDVMVLNDMWGDAEDARIWQRGAAAAAERAGVSLDDIRWAHSYMRIPIVAQQRLIGLISLHHEQPNFYTPQHVRLARAVADQAAVAVENARLFEETQQAGRETAALLGVAQSIASTIELGALLEVIVEQLRTVIDCYGVTVLTREGDEVTLLDVTNPAAGRMDPPRGGRRVPAAGAIWQAMERGETLTINDVWREDDAWARRYRNGLGDRIDDPQFKAVRSWMAVPLETPDRVGGMLHVSSMEYAYFTPQRQALVRGIANQAAVAVENARLFEETQQQTRELTALLEVGSNVSSTLELQPLLRLILEQVQSVVPYDRSGIMIREGDELASVAMLARPGLEMYPGQLGLRVPVSESGLVWELIAQGKPAIIDDLHDYSPLAVEYRERNAPVLELAFERVGSFMAVPIMRNQEAIGMMMFTRTEPHAYRQRNAELATAIGSQAAVAIENARLFEETQQQTRELSALLDVSHTVASTLDRNELVGLVLDQLKKIIDYTGATVALFEGNALTILESRSPRGDSRGVSVPIGQPAILWDRILALEAILIDDIHDPDDPLAVAYLHTIGDLIATPGFSHVRSWMGVPLAPKDQAIGVITISNAEPKFFTDRHARLARAVADQAAIALDNSRLFEETQRRARETEALFRADEQLFQTLSLDAVFQALVDVCVDVLGVPKSMVTTIDDADGHYTVRASRNIAAASLEHMLAIRSEKPRGVLAGISESIVNADARAIMPEMEPVFAAEGIYTTVDVPIKSTGTLRGVLGAAYTSKRIVTADELRLLQALAERAAIAIDNAELYERAQQVASLEERQKLARELHDSVSQALYGIALGARTARTLLDRDPSKAIEPVDYVLSLAEAGLTEMRALIFELRPESLETEGLVVAIEKNVAATQARYGIEVTADLGAEPKAPLDVKEAAYRIAQEALHNIVKHAHATHVDVRLTREDGTLTLVVQDNGIGFDTGGAFPGHIGLSSMRERTAKSNGVIEIVSAPGEGTRITARLRI